jgi:hypothetical protein
MKPIFTLKSVKPPGCDIKLKIRLWLTICKAWIFFFCFESKKKKVLLPCSIIVRVYSSDTRWAPSPALPSFESYPLNTVWHLTIWQDVLRLEIAVLTARDICAECTSNNFVLVYLKQFSTFLLFTENEPHKNKERILIHFNLYKICLNNCCRCVEYLQSVLRFLFCVPKI